MVDFEIAVLADIHGNTWALKEVLKDIKKIGIMKIVNLGDSLYGPLDPAGTAEILIVEGIDSISGNQDRVIVDNIDEPAVNPTLEFVRKELDNRVFNWVKAQRDTMVLDDDYFLCHGTPTSDTDYLLEKVTPEGVKLRDSVELDSRLKAIEQPVILCGHSHMQHVVYTSSGKWIVNPGSVGLPAYDDDLPYPHVMESGHPHANYCVITAGKDGYYFRQAAVPYDWEAAAACAQKNNRGDWARWLRTGRV